MDSKLDALIEKIRQAKQVSIEADAHYRRTVAACEAAYVASDKAHRAVFELEDIALGYIRERTKG